MDMSSQSERVSWQEAEAVIRLYRAKSGMEDSVSLQNLARSLGVPESEALDMLEHVRSGARHSRPRLVDRSGYISAALAAAAAIVIAALIQRHPSATSHVSATMTADRMPAVAWPATPTAKVAPRPAAAPSAPIAPKLEVYSYDHHAKRRLSHRAAAHRENETFVFTLTPSQSTL